MSLSSIEALHRRDGALRVSPDENLFEVQADEGVLQRFLRIQPPEESSKTPPILAFDRKREVELPWAEILPRNEDSRVCTAAIREYFEESWDVELNGSMDHSTLLGSVPWRVKKLEPPPAPPTASEPSKPYIEPYSVCLPDFDNLDAEGKPTVRGLTEGFVIRHGTSGRLYHLLISEGHLGEDHFQNFENYETAWQKRIHGVVLVFDSPEEALSGYMALAEIDLRPALIQRKYEELSLLLKFAQAVKTNVSATTDEMIKRIMSTTLGADELEQLQRRVLRLEMSEYDVQRRIERLASDAARLGFLLFIGATEEPNGDGKGPKLQPGKLYTTYQRTARWTEYQSVYAPTLFWPWGTSKFKIPRVKEQIVEDYQAVDTSKDILAEKRSELIRSGKHVYVFEQTPAGWVSTDGEPLRQIMDCCTHDESFRRTCVVMLPVYEDSLTGQRLVAKYAVYERPLPGLIPTILPRLSLEESLTYRTAWLETRLGELLSSINLAPDEQRQVTITKRFEQETAVTRTSTSIFDISRAETTDLATEMESQTKREQESSASIKLNTKAGGSYGPFNAEASASAGTSSSLKDMSQAISKVARRAAKSVSSQNREEVTSTTTARTTISNTDETVATIHNINQGRSLNLLFYRLYNKYQGGLFLEDLRFNVLPSVEVIAGSGVYESRSYSCEELPHMIDEFKAAKLPVKIIDEQAYTDALVNSIDGLLNTEYSIHGDEDIEKAVRGEAKGSPAERSSLSVARLFIPPPETSRLEAEVGDGNARPGAEKRGNASVEGLRNRLRRRVLLSDEPIAPQELLIAAPGLYLDAVVGAQPSTEPYSERMREQTVALKRAEVMLTQADARYREALAQHLAQNCGNWIVGITPDANSNTLILTLKFPLAVGKWDFVLDGVKQCEVPAGEVGRSTVNLHWDTEQPWLADDGLMNQRLELHDRDKGIVLSRV